MLPELTQAQADELQAKKDGFAKENPERAEDGVCTNPKCRCPTCPCGKGCTCNVSMVKVCEDCTLMKKKMMQTTTNQAST